MRRITDARGVSASRGSHLVRAGEDRQSVLLAPFSTRLPPDCCDASAWSRCTAVGQRIGPPRLPALDVYLRSAALEARARSSSSRRTRRDFYTRGAARVQRALSTATPRSSARRDGHGCGRHPPAKSPAALGFEQNRLSPSRHAQVLRPWRRRGGMDPVSERQPARAQAGEAECRTMRELAERPRRRPSTGRSHATDVLNSCRMCSWLHGVSSLAKAVRRHARTLNNAASPARRSPTR